MLMLMTSSKESTQPKQAETVQFRLEIAFVYALPGGDFLFSPDCMAKMVFQMSTALVFPNNSEFGACDDAGAGFPFIPAAARIF